MYSYILAIVLLMNGTEFFQLEWTLEELFGRLLSCSIGLRIGTIGGSSWRGNEPSGYMKWRDILRVFSENH